MAVVSKFYFYIDGSPVYQGQTTDTEWNVESLDLQYYNIYQWRVDTYDTDTELTTTGDVWTCTTERSNFGFERRSDYDDDDVWDPADEAWEDNPGILAEGGGRYRQQLVAIGHNCIYFGDV